MDGIDRVHVTGQFAGTIDFDPSSIAADNKTSAGGLDLFVTRLAHPTGTLPGTPVQYDGTFTIGGSYDEVGTAIAIEGLRSLRLAHVGWFGAPDSPNGYTVDFDPFGGTANKSGNGGADAFVNSLVPTIPTNMKAAASFVYDGSNSITVPDDYVAMLEAFKVHINDAAVSAPFTQPTIPRDGTVALSACTFGHIFEAPQGFPPYVPTGKTGDQIVPWTVIRANSVELFARRLRNQPRYRTEEPNQAMTDGVRAALASQYGDRISACYSSIIMVADGGHTPQFTPVQWQQYTPTPAQAIAQMQDARDDVIAETNPAPDDVNVNQINGLAVLGDFFQASWSRAYLLSNVVDSDENVTTNPSQPYGFGLGLETTPPPNAQQFADPLYSVHIRRLLRRSTRCPGDLNRDGAVDGLDQTTFNQLTLALDPDADLNGDGLWNANDASMFTTALQLGCCP